jgi:formate-dependent nitrite reductase cytochrome c552 subunit
LFHQPERNAEHVVCGDDAKVTCVDCHMPLTAKTGGGLNLHSHQPGIIPPSDTELYGIPSSCSNGGCHTGQDVDWLQAAYERHYLK